MLLSAHSSCCEVVPPDEKNVRLLESDTNVMEKRKRLARLLGSSSMPTRASLKAEIKARRGALERPELAATLPCDARRGADRGRRTIGA